MKRLIYIAIVLLLGGGCAQSSGDAAYEKAKRQNMRDSMYLDQLEREARKL